MDERTQVKQKFQPAIQALEAQEERGQFPRALLACDDLHEMLFFIGYFGDVRSRPKVNGIPDYTISHGNVFPGSSPLTVHKIDSIVYGVKQGFDLDLLVIGIVPFSEQKRTEALFLGKVISAQTSPDRTNLSYIGDFGDRRIAVYTCLPNCTGYKHEDAPLNLVRFT